MVKIFKSHLYVLFHNSSVTSVHLDSIFDVAGIILIGLFGLILGPMCYGKPGAPHSVCKAVRSQHVAAALLSIGVTVAIVLVVILIIEIYTRKFDNREDNFNSAYMYKSPLKLIDAEMAVASENKFDLDQVDERDEDDEITGSGENSKFSHQSNS